MRHARIATLAVATLLAGGACSKSRPAPGTLPGGTVTIPGGGPGGGSVTVGVADCTKCHGDATRTPLATDAAGIAIAPPRDAAGLTTGAKVGAHLAHLRGTSGLAPTWRSAGVDCASCHVVPATASTHAQPGVQFRGLAATSWPGAPAITPAYGASGCAATYCHGNFPGGLARTMSWTGTSADAACGSCHGIPPAFQRDGTTPHSNSTLCASCHGAGYAITGITGAALATHLDGVLEVSGGHPGNWVDTNLANRGGPHAIAYNEGGAAACAACHGATLAGAGAAPACTACHDGGSHAVPIGGTTVVGPIVAFNPGGTPNCTACHGTSGRGADTAGTDTSPAPPLATKRTTARPDSGSHAKHAVAATGSSTMAPLATLTCNQCHATPSLWYHADAAVTFTWGNVATAGGAAPAFDQASNGCATVYCHGGFRNGNAANAPVWGSPATAACGTCHGLPPAGSHPVIGTESCGTCHAGYSSTTVNAAVHVNGAIDVKGSTCTLAAGCTITDCTACHGNPPTTTTGLSGAIFYHPQNDNCAACHGAGYSKTGPTTGTVNPTTHQNGTVDVAGTLSCTTCHGTGGRANSAGAVGAFDANQPAAPPQDTTGATTGTRVGAHLAHVDPPASGQVYPPLACAECHSGAVPAAGNNLHSSGTTTVAFSGKALANGATPNYASGNCNASYCHGGTLPAYAKGSFASWTWSATGAGCGSCHAYPPAAPHTTNTNCNSCHPGTVGPDNVTIDVAGGLHIDGTVEFVEPGTGGTSCGTCHPGYFNAMNGTVTKVSKHGVGTDSPVDGAFSWTGTDLTSSVTLANRSCITMCHGDHPHTLTSPVTATHENNLYFDATTQASRADGSASLVGAGGTGTQDRAKTDFDSTQNAGACTSCHQKPVAAGGLTVSAATFGASAHDFSSNTAGTTYAWSYQIHDGSLFLRNCTKCHASRAEGNTPAVAGTALPFAAVHSSDTDPHLLAGTTNPAGSAANFVCYNCHGSAASPAAGAQGNRSGKDIQSQIAHATTAGQSGHPANSDAVHDSTTEFNNAAFGNTLGVTGRHANCLDCHDPHEARAGTHAQGTNVAGPPLQGAWGAKFGGTLAAWAVPTSANFTKTTIAAGTDLEATLCFKCHSAYYGALPTSPSSSPAFTETDQAREFNPANPSFHPVLASNSATIGNTGNVLVPWTRTSLMTCTDCHESDLTTDPNGPHGSAAKFILKGPNTTWNATLQPATGGTMPAGTFCANCHAASFSGSRFPHTNGSHEGSQRGAPVYCMSCHVAIPHGSGHVGLLVSVSNGGTPAGGVQVTDSAPYAVNPRLGIFSYPANNTTAWANSNCGCDSVSNGH